MVMERTLIMPIGWSRSYIDRPGLMGEIDGFRQGPTPTHKSVLARIVSTWLRFPGVDMRLNIPFKGRRHFRALKCQGSRIALDGAELATLSTRTLVAGEHLLSGSGAAGLLIDAAGEKSSSNECATMDAVSFAARLSRPPGCIGIKVLAGSGY